MTSIKDPQASASEPRFAVPALPSRLHPSAAAASANLQTVQAAAPATSKRPPPAPKTTFPDAHLPLLLTRIISLATGSLTYIVETLHQELKDQRVKKNAIEAKVREVGEKCKMQKIWVVKPAVKAAHGLA